MRIVAVVAVMVGAGFLLAGIGLFGWNAVFHATGSTVDATIVDVKTIVTEDGNRSTSPVVEFVDQEGNKRTAQLMEGSSWSEDSIGVTIRVLQQGSNPPRVRRYSLFLLYGLPALIALLGSVVIGYARCKIKEYREVDYDLLRSSQRWK